MTITICIGTTIIIYTTPSYIPTFIENLDIFENGSSLSFVQMRADFQTDVWLNLEHCVVINNKFPTFEKLLQNIIASQSKTEMKANITKFLNQKVIIIAKSNNNQLLE
ncbi:hypothetical protein [Enterococcus durans]|uniref:hypothetical protein n=1 Tax=Enterococcus durans TaxID=53345 RepID=UPI00193C1237|nr:hypothetical protein [Enterococcus durans]